jgi:hypothetical protein
MRRHQSVIHALLVNLMLATVAGAVLGCAVDVTSTAVSFPIPSATSIPPTAVPALPSPASGAASVLPATDTALQASGSWPEKTLEEVVHQQSAVLLGRVRDVLPERWATENGEREPGRTNQRQNLPDGWLKRRNFAYQPAIVEVERFVVPPHAGHYGRTYMELLPKPEVKEVSIRLERGGITGSLSIGEHVVLALGSPTHVLGYGQPVWYILGKWVVDGDEATVQFPPPGVIKNSPARLGLEQLVAEIERIHSDQERGVQPVLSPMPATPTATPPATGATPMPAQPAYP